MKPRSIIFIAVTIFSFLAALNFARGQNTEIYRRKLIVFYSPGCHECTKARNELIPKLQEEFKDQLQVEYRNIDKLEDYMFLLSLMKRHNVDIEIVTPVFYIDGSFLNGSQDFKNKLKSIIAKALNVPYKEKGLPAVDLFEHFKSFRIPAIVSAGLIDGINPCAFTVIVFFISFLALQGYKKKELIVIGLAFIFAVFLTYLLIGLGMFNFLYQLRSFWLVTKIVNISVGIFSIVLGALAVYDFFKFKKTLQTEGLILQLPPAIKNRIHSIIGMHYRKSKEANGQSARPHIFILLISTLITGFLVSILEAVCTGQVYLPTIVFVLKTTPFALKALGYLVLYNLMFIGPLFIIFLFALSGATSQQFSKFLKKHLGLIRILMAFLFFALGIFLLWKA